ncbi:MAG: GntR family transcriptional regulator [Lachnospiraceae bacterium]|nr:GntR family transcriptional regulator [Lachnospiraceae bacterium]
MIIEIDFNSPQAIYIQLKNQIVVAIAQDKLKEGQSLPSVRQMADTLGVNMHTVNKAYAILRQEGYLKLDRRKGAVISVEADKDAEMEALYEEMEMLVARAVCKGVSREDMTRIVQNMYDTFEGESLNL